jgi:DNA primase
MFEFVIDQRLAGFALSTVEGRAGALRAAAPIVAEIRDPSLRPGYVRVLARRLGLELGEVRAAVDRAARSGSGGSHDEPRAAQVPAPQEPGASEPLVRVTIASLPRRAEVALERDTLMGLLQFGHRLDPALLERSVTVPFRHPALEAVRQAIAAAPDVSRPGWAADAVSTVREPYRSLAAELLTADFPALTDDAATVSATSLARRLVVRAVDQQKTELLGAIQRVAPVSEEGRSIRMRLRELDAERQRLAADQ